MRRHHTLPESFKSSCRHKARFAVVIPTQRHSPSAPDTPTPGPPAHAQHRARSRRAIARAPLPWPPIPALLIARPLRLALQSCPPKAMPARGTCPLQARGARVGRPAALTRHPPDARRRTDHGKVPAFARAQKRGSQRGRSRTARRSRLLRAAATRRRGLSSAPLLAGSTRAPVLARGSTRARVPGLL